MDWIVTAGSLCLGLLIGSMVGWHFNAKVSTDRILKASVSALVGGAVIAMFNFLAGFQPPPHEIWFYPVGLLAGFMTVTVIEIKKFGYAGEKYAAYMRKGKAAYMRKGKKR
jgi:hypothetical protein